MVFLFLCTYCPFTCFLWRDVYSRRQIHAHTEWERERDRDTDTQRESLMTSIWKIMYISTIEEFLLLDAFPFSFLAKLSYLALLFVVNRCVPCDAYSAPNLWGSVQFSSYCVCELWTFQTWLYLSERTCFNILFAWVFNSYMNFVKRLLKGSCDVFEPLYVLSLLLAICTEAVLSYRGKFLFTSVDKAIRSCWMWFAAVE